MGISVEIHFKKKLNLYLQIFILVPILYLPLGLNFYIKIKDFMGVLRKEYYRTSFLLEMTQNNSCFGPLEHSKQIMLF